MPERGSPDWQAGITAAYFAHPRELVEKIAARYGCCAGHVSYLARRAVKRGEAQRMRGKGSTP